MEYIDDDEYKITPKELLEFDNVIYLGTFSKAYGLGGMRVGYGIANEDIIKLLHKVRTNQFYYKPNTYSFRFGWGFGRGF